MRRWSPDESTLYILLSQATFRWRALIHSEFSACEVGPAELCIIHGACSCGAFGRRTRRVCHTIQTSGRVIWEDLATPQCLR